MITIFLWILIMMMVAVLRSLLILSGVSVPEEYFTTINKIAQITLVIQASITLLAFIFSQLSIPKRHKKSTQLSSSSAPIIETQN